MRLTRTITGLAATGVLAVTAVTAATISASSASSTPSAIGLVDAGDRLRAISLSKPSDVRSLGKIDGFNAASSAATADTTLIGIDYRVQDGRYYGVGNQGGVYRITNGGNVTRVSQLTEALDPTPGARFGVDFNPAADRLRIVSSTGQNLRHNVNAGGTTVSDTRLTYPAASGTGTEPALGIVGAAYTNNDLNPATATTLFDLDAAADRIALQSPANAGTLAVTGLLGFNASPIAGFDIVSKVSGNRAVSDTAYASLRTSDTADSSLYKIDVLSGKATKIGSFKRGISDIAIRQPKSTVPAS